MQNSTSETPLVSGDDYNVINEDSSLEDELLSGAEDFSELSEETNAVIEETIDIIATTEEVEKAEEAGMLSDLSLRVYRNSVNAYLNKLEDRYIIAKDDRLQSGMQFDTPQAGLLSVTETLKNAIRKVIEWLAKGVQYYLNWINIVIEKIKQFVLSRAKISNSLREKVKKAKEKNSEVYINVDKYKKVIQNNSLSFIYASVGRLAEFSGDKLNLSLKIVQQELDVDKCLQLFEDILEEKSDIKIPTVNIESNELVIRDTNNVTKLEKAVIDRIGQDVLKNTSLSKFKDATTKDLRVIVGKDKLFFLLYDNKGSSLLSAVSIKLFVTDDQVYKDNITIKANAASKPSMFIGQLDYLVKIIDDASAALRKMSQDASSRSNAVKAWSENNAKAAQKEIDDKSGKTSGIFNEAFMKKLKEDAYTIWFYPMVVSEMVASLSAAVKDGITLLEASLIENPNKEDISSDNTSKTGNILLIGAPKK